MTPAAVAMDVEFGNAGALDTAGTGWFIGFSAWTRSGPAALRQIAADAPTRGLCMKWFAHAAGDPNGEDKPLSEGRTISILVSEASEFCLEFSPERSFPDQATQRHTLRRHGDFVIWGAGLYHRAFGRAPATVLTARWSDA